VRFGAGRSARAARCARRARVARDETPSQPRGGTARNRAPQAAVLPARHRATVCDERHRSLPVFARGHHCAASSSERNSGRRRREACLFPRIQAVDSQPKPRKPPETTGILANSATKMPHGSAWSGSRQSRQPTCRMVLFLSPYRGRGSDHRAVGQGTRAHPTSGIRRDGGSAMPCVSHPNCETARRSRTRAKPRAIPAYRQAFVSHIEYHAP
jgi:hypothetical protein